MTLPKEYVPLADFDTSFLPDDFDQDELVPLDNEEHVCYNCGDVASFYNLTIEAHVCEAHSGRPEDV